MVDGNVDGPIQAKEVLLKSQAHVVGDIHHQSLSIESGAFFDGRSVQGRGNGQLLKNSKVRGELQILRKASLVVSSEPNPWRPTNRLVRLG